MLDRTALPRPNRLGLFGMASEAAVDHIVATVPRSAADGCTALYLRLALHAARQNRSSLAHGQGCIVAVPELALRLGCSVRSVQRRLALLVSAGVLEVFGRHDRTGRALMSDYVFRYYQERSGPPVVTPEARSTLNWVSSGPAALQGHQHITSRTVTQDVVQQAPGAPYSADRPVADRVSPPGPGDAVDAPPYLEEDETSIDSAKDRARAQLAAYRARARATTASTGCATTTPVAAVPVVRCPVAPERTPAVPPAPAPAAGDSPPCRPTPPRAAEPLPVGRAVPGRLPVPLSALLPRGGSGLGERSAQVFAQRRQNSPLNGETSGSSRPIAPASG